MKPFHSAYSDLPLVRPLWHIGLVTFIAGFVLSVLAVSLMKSLPKNPRQGATQQCPCQCAAHTDERGLVGLARSHLGLPVQQAQTPLLLGQEPLGAVGAVAALPPSKFGIAPLFQGVNVELPQFIQLATFHEFACKPRNTVHPSLL